MKYFMAITLFVTSMSASAVLIIKKDRSEQMMGVVVQKNARKKMVQIRGNNKKTYKVKLDNVYTDVLNQADKSQVKAGHAVMFKVNTIKPLDR